MGDRVIYMPDWLDAELLIVFAMAAAGVWAMIAEAREHRRDAAERIGLHSRLSVVETAIALQHPSSIAERVAALEAVTETDKTLRERVAVVEARIDYKLITHTRAKDGKFSRTGADTCETP